MPKYFCGVGSRETPPDILTMMEKIAMKLAGDGWTLRSGHAQGADRAFERGAEGNAVIYLPWAGFGIKPYKSDPGMPVMGKQVLVTQQELYANYDKLLSLGIRSKQFAPANSVRCLHGRNLFQVLGHNYGDPPSKFVLCWCEEVAGKPQGGTATAVKLARHHGIEVFNLLHAEVRKRFEQYLED